MNSSNISSTPHSSFWQFLRQKFIAPTALGAEIGAQRRAELLAGISFLLSISTLIGSITAYIVQPGVFGSATISLGITSLMSLTAYILSRTRYFVWGSTLITLALSLTAFLTVIGGTYSVSSALFSSIPIALIIASALFSVRGLVVTLIANLAGIIMLPSLVSYVNTRDIASAGGVIATFGFLLIIFGNVRNAIERARLAELAQTNQKLETLHASLEQRFEERTHELKERSNELAKAQENTQALLTELGAASRLARIANFKLKEDTQTVVFSDLFYELLNTNAEKEGGYELTIPQAIERFVHSEDAPRLLEYIESIGSARIEGSTEYRLRDANGTFRTFSIRFDVETGEEGRSTDVRGIAQDITERTQSEQALRKFQLALERSTDAVFMTDPDGIIEYVNPAFEKTYGFFAEEAIGKNPRIIKSGLISQEQYAYFWQTLLNDEVVAGEIINKHKDGRLLPVEAMNASILDEQGNRLGFMATHRDITSRKQAEDALAKRAAELETVTQVATSIATIQDPEALLQFVSDLVKERFNFYHAHVYLLDEQDGMLELAAGAGEAGQTMVAQKHAIPLTQEQSLVARAGRTRQGVVANDVFKDSDFLPNPLLPDTRAELAVPLIVRDRVIGVLDVQSAQVDAFTEEAIRIQTILAAQIAIALDNARANEQTAKTLAELDTLTRRLTHKGWQTYLTEQERAQMGYVFEGNQLVPLTKEGDYKPAETEKYFVHPITLHGERIGQLVASEVEMEEGELQTILTAVSQGLSAHLENLRLTEEAERRVNELDIINDIGQALATEVDLQRILETVIEKLSRAFNANIAYTALYDPAQQMIHIPYMFDHGQIVQNEPSFPFGQDVNSTIIQTRQRIFINQDTERRLTEFGALPTVSNNTMSKSFMGVPLISGENVLGVLSVQDSEREGRFTQGDLELLTTIAANVAVAIQNAQLFAQTQKRAEREAMVNLIGQKIQSATSVQGALQTAIQELGLALKARRTVVELATKSTEKDNPQKIRPKASTVLPNPE